MTQQIEQLAERIGELLAASPLDQKFKDAILENLDTMPEDLVFKLKDVLEGERDEADTVISEIEIFLKEQDERWAKLEEEQQKAASDVADELFDKIKDQ
ncbi:MAG: hypothetical protein AAB638_02090 [Patescibacteria group bacterium]